MIKPRQIELLENAIEAIRATAGINIKHIPPEGVAGPPVEADAALQLTLPDGRETVYLAEIKQTVAEAVIGQIAHRFAADPRPWMLVAGYVYPKLGATLRQLGVQFIDATGNAYIDNPPTLIHIQAHRRERDTFAAREEGMMGRAGLKLLFALLCKPELRDARYRDMAWAAHVALGTVAGVVKDLTRRGYLVEFEPNLRRIVRKKELLEKWTIEYANKVRPKTLVGRFKAMRPDFWQNFEMRREGTYWGGETAAHRLTHYLKPEIVTVYTRQPMNEIVLDFKLRRDDNGDVEIRRRFWEFENDEPDKTTVPPLLIYADLMATGDARNIETAKMIYDDYLQRYIGQD